MKFIMRLLIVLVIASASFAADSVNWREIWDGDKQDWWNKSIPELRKLVAEKNPFATLILADKLIDVDRAEALKLREQAVAYGLPQAMLWLSEDSSTPRRRKIELIKSAADLGHPKAMLSLARYSFAKNIHPDYDKTLSLLRALVDQGEAEAMSDLAELYSSGIGEPRTEKEKPINLLRMLAAKGDESIEHDLESRLRQGIGTDIDLLEAAYYYFRYKSRHLLVQGRTPSPIAQRFNVRQDPGAMLAISRQSDIRHDPNRETVEHLDTLFDDAFTRRDTAALTELAKLHENGTYGKTNLARACALLTFANSPAAAEKTKLLTSAQMQAMQRDLRWMRELPVRK